VGRYLRLSGNIEAPAFAGADPEPVMVSAAACRSGARARLSFEDDDLVDPRRKTHLADHLGSPQSSFEQEGPPTPPLATRGPARAHRPDRHGRSALVQGLNKIIYRFGT
jgi:hypothetical protein